MRAVHIWMEIVLAVRRVQRDETGGVSDETAMIGLMLIAAVAVGGIILGLVTGAANRLDFGF